LPVSRSELRYRDAESLARGPQAADVEQINSLNAPGIHLAQRVMADQPRAASGGGARVQVRQKVERQPHRYLTVRVVIASSEGAFMRSVLAASIAALATTVSGCAFETADDGSMEDVEAEPMEEPIPQDEWAVWDAEASDTEQMKATTPQCTRSAGANSPGGTIEVAFSRSGLSNCWMDRGSFSSGVRALQRALVFCWGKSIAIDSDYGPQTAAAVASLQQGLGIRRDGVYGPETAAATRFGWALVGVDRCGNPRPCPGCN
jgi:peptidoglycan hydrolase-like protein with peptidoglycan-binding domain